MKKTTIGVPTAHVCIHKSRLKTYNTGEHPTYYLEKGTEFQIELFNPTTDNIVARIEMNGKPISQGGIILRPGERAFLERYIDSPNKFLFDTYEVGASDEVKAAIKDNGDLCVKFFRERKEVNPIWLYNSPSVYTYTNGITSSPTYNANNFNLTSNSATVDLSNTLYDSNTTCDSYSTSINGDFNLTGSLGLNSVSASAPIKPSGMRSFAKKSKSIETGRVEMGSTSRQQFKTVDMKFEYFPFHTIGYKLLPKSQKLNTAQDLNLKVYCPNCGSKLKKEWKFCAACGSKK